MVAGPTAAGKSEAALTLATELHGEIVSVDSMQVYRGMDIGTAKPSPAERDRVPHHLIDVADCHESFDAARFVALAQTAIAGIRERRRLPILCGGTGLYFKALLEGLGDSPPTDAALRSQLEAIPMADLLLELQTKDPATFARLDRQNPRRVRRAVEIIRLTGKPASAQRAQWLKPASPPALLQAPIFVVRRAVDDLRSRIDARVDRMFAQGLVEETRRLVELGLAQNPTALQAIGYRQVVEHLRGERSLSETIELVKVRTRQFAKRQMTWFRGQLPAHWLDVAPDEQPARVASRIQEAFGRPDAGP